MEIFERIKRPCRIRNFCYRGFLVEIFDNKIYDFAFEYKITPITRQAKRLLKYNRKFIAYVYDPTSHRFSRMARYYAMSHVESFILLQAKAKTNKE